MQTFAVPFRIAVRVCPPMFAETLARAPGRPDLELVLSTATAADAQGYDGALLSRSAPEGEREVPLHTLEAILGLVEELWPRAGG